MIKRLGLLLAFVLAAVMVGTAAVAATVSLQSGGDADHVLVDDTTGTVGPGGVGNSVSCPEGYYVTGGGYEFGNNGFHATFDGPVAGWGSLGTAWSVAGSADSAGTLTVWASCLELT